MIKSKSNSEHYTWGENCSGWRLVNSPSLTVIEELMPPHTFEQRHFHQKAQQFFQILKGRAHFIIDNQSIEVDAGQGIHISPNTIHQIRNDQNEDLEFIVISEPSTKNDRIEI